MKYIPEFEKYFKSYITIRQCLSHMTGIKDEEGMLKKLIKRRKLESLEEEIQAGHSLRAPEFLFTIRSQILGQM